MTRPRLSPAQESPFGRYIRTHRALDSRDTGLTVTDIDWCFHKYAPHVDGLGTRDVQLMLFLELKCYNAEPRPSQVETLSLLHQRCCSKAPVYRPERSPTMLWHFGVYVLSLPGVTPDDSAACRWGAFDAKGCLGWRTIPTAWIPELLGFTRRPDDFQALSLRRHHAVEAFIARETTPLGFPVDTVVVKRS